jgi:hypothetical protein
LSTQIIRWPTPERQREIAAAVEDACELTGVVGFLDGTHIRLSAALQGDRDYFNRKGFPSIQLQVTMLFIVTVLDILFRMHFIFGCLITTSELINLIQ